MLLKNGSMKMRLACWCAREGSPRMLRGRTIGLCGDAEPNFPNFGVANVICELLCAQSTNTHGEERNAEYWRNGYCQGFSPNCATTCGCATEQMPAECVESELGDSKSNGSKSQSEKTTILVSFYPEFRNSEFQQAQVRVGICCVVNL
jgi:hypothetical protein